MGDGLPGLVNLAARSHETATPIPTSGRVLVCSQTPTGKHSGEHLDPARVYHNSQRSHTYIYPGKGNRRSTQASHDGADVMGKPHHETGLLRPGSETSQSSSLCFCPVPVLLPDRNTPARLMALSLTPLQFGRARWRRVVVPTLCWPGQFGAQNMDASCSGWGSNAAGSVCHIHRCAVWKTWL